MKIEIERSYDIIDQPKLSPRYLVDRLWPRGIKKELLQLDLWVKELSPSDSLRKWYNHDPEKFEAFKNQYFKELDNQPDEVGNFINAIHKQKNIILVYSSTERVINNAAVLKEYLLNAMKK